jgi:quinol monooxygenase YgiN
VTFIDGIAGQEDDLVEHLLSLAGPTRAEPGNRQYDLYRSVERPSRFVRLEQWTDANALEVHKAMPYMRDSFARRQREGWTTRITLWRRLDP